MSVSTLFASNSSKNHSNFCHSVLLDGGEPLNGRKIPAMMRILKILTNQRSLNRVEYYLKMKILRRVYLRE